MTPIEVRPNRLVHLIAIPICAIVMYAFYWAIFVGPDRAGIDGMFRIMCGFVMLVGGVMIVVSINRFIKNPYIFRMDDEGIIINEGGVSSGLVRWEDIASVKETLIPSGNRHNRLVPVLAVYLTESAARQPRYNKLLQSVADLGSAITGASLYITPARMGKQYPAIKAELERRTTSAADTVTPAHQSTIIDELAPQADNWAVRYIRHMYEVRTGKSKPNWKVYLPILLFVGAIAHDFFLGQPLQLPLVPVFFGGYFLLIVYAVIAGRRSGQDAANDTTQPG